MSIKTFMTVFFAFMVAIGLIALLIGVMGVSATLSTGGWSVTQGTVIDTSIYREWGSGGHGSGGHWTYYPVVAYQYHVQGVTYNSSRISAVHMGSDYNYALGVVNKYPNGTMVEVHYDPNNPANSMLDTSIGLPTLIPLILGIVFTSIGGAGLWYARSRKDNLLNDTTVRGVIRTGVVWGPCLSMELRHDEKVLWRGRPERRSFLLSYGRQSAIVSFFFLAFASVWTAVAFLAGAGTTPIILGTIFIVIGLASVLVGFSKQTGMHRHTEYTVTDERIIVQEGRRELKRKQVPLEKLGEVYVNRNAVDKMFGTGSLILSDTKGVDMASLRHPYQVREAILEAANKVRNRAISERAY